MAEGRPNGVNGVLAGISEKLIRALPPAMTVLVVLNVLFLGVVGYVVQHNATARNELLRTILESCLRGKS